MTRSRQATATVIRVKGGDLILVTPDDRAMVMDSVEEAEQAAYRSGAAVIRWINVSPGELQ